MSERTILVVCDEPTVARELVATVAGLGYDAVAATFTRAEATAAVARLEPALVLVDASLDGNMTGSGTVEVVDDLRRAWPGPILVLTAGADEEPTSWGGITLVGSLARPFAPQELRLNIELALCRHHAVREAREQEDRFFAVSLDMLCFLDFNGYFKRLNPAWERTLGFTREELMSRPFIDFVHPDDRQRTMEQNARVRQGGQALAFENRYLCKDGSFRWLRWNATPEITERVIYSVARDCTVRKQAEEERERLVRELQGALAEVRALREILPICSYCRKIRDDENYWQTVESYISRHTNSRFSHGICPSCLVTEIR